MKKVTFLIILAVSSCYVYSQSIESKLSIGDIIQLTNNIKVESHKLILATEEVEETTNRLDILMYRVVDIIDDNVHLIALPFKNKSAKLAKYYNNIEYIVSKFELEKNCKIITEQDRARLKLGIVTLPYKVRPFGGPLSFDTEFNLKTTINIRVSNPNSSLLKNIIIGSGTGSIQLDALNSQLSSGDPIQVTTLSLLGGFMFEANSVQIGLFTGVDWINNQEEIMWDQHGKFWFGLGMGYNIFNIKNQKIKN